MGEDAEKLEKAGKGEDYDYIRENNDKLLDLMAEFKDNLAPLCGKDEDEDDERFDRILVKSAYDTLIKAAGEKDDRMIDMTLKEIAEYDIPEKHRDRMDRIRLSFMRKDYDEIISLSATAEGML